MCHADDEVSGESVDVSQIVRRNLKTVDMWIYRPASFEEVAVYSQPNLGREAKEGRGWAWGLAVLGPLGDGAPLGTLPVTLALVATGVAHFDLAPGREWARFGSKSGLSRCK